MFLQCYTHLLDILVSGLADCRNVGGGEAEAEEIGDRPQNDDESLSVLLRPTLNSAYEREISKMLDLSRDLPNNGATMAHISGRPHLPKGVDFLLSGRRIYTWLPEQTVS